MKYLILILLTLFLTNCAIYMGRYNKIHNVDCSGIFGNMNICINKASKTCNGEYIIITQGTYYWRRFLAFTCMGVE